MTETKAGDDAGRSRWHWLRGIGEFPGRAWSTLVADPKRRRWGLPVFVLGVLVFLYAVLAPVAMMLNYRFPAPSTGPVAPAEGEPPGVAYVDALLRVHDEGLRPWLPNDRIYPTVFLDNPQSHQLGQLEGLRYAVRILRDHLSRQRTTDALDPDVEEAHARLNIAAGSWMFPRAEDEYARAAAALRRYRARLVAGRAHFYPRADNLVELLNQINSLVGSANTRLYNCVPDVKARLSEETLGDPSLRGESVVRTPVSWRDVDDHFYYARGVAHVYREVLRAVGLDFHQVLELRNADEMVDGMLVDFLDHSQFEPLVVTNGDFGSLLANHPQQLLSVLSQVRERSRSLVTMLDVNVR